MKIRTRLSFQFTGLFAILFSILIVSIYFVVAKQWSNNFFRELEDRAITVGHNYLAEDNFTKEEYQEVLKKFPRTLPEEQIRIYTANFKPTYINENDLKWDKSFLEQIVKKKRIQYKNNQEYVVGIYYKDNSGNYIIVAKAVDKIGEKALSQLKTIMLFSLFIALLIAFILSRFFSLSILRPIQSIINHVQNKNVETLIQPIPVEYMSNDEIKSLSETINSLFERLYISFDNQQSFVAHASHELKTPIAAMLGNAEIALSNERSKEEYKDVLLGISKDAIHINHIINNLLELSKLNASDFNSEENSFEEFWWTTIDNIVANDSSINLKLTIATQEDLMNLYFIGNANLLSVALTNIIHNAHKFSYHQPVEVILNTDDQYIIIIVSDNGIGIKHEDLEKLFLPFFRSSNALSIQGTGLGLSLSSKIVALHKGILTIESTINIGTKVTIKLPKTKTLL